jgi:hypothetical protein
VGQGLEAVSLLAPEVHWTVSQLQLRTFFNAGKLVGLEREGVWWQVAGELDPAQCMRNIYSTYRVTDT